MTKTTTPDTAGLLALLRGPTNHPGLKPLHDRAADRIAELEAALANARLGEEESEGNLAHSRHQHRQSRARIEALERALDEIIMEATSRNHAIDIARQALRKTE